MPLPNRKYPPVSRDLLEYMNACFPDACPDPAMTDREIWMAVGQRKAVQKLQAIYDFNNESKPLNG